jgi:ubiquinone/menaquinone biosynthesis C-methylase UbiE
MRRIYKSTGGRTRLVFGRLTWKSRIMSVRPSGDELHRADVWTAVAPSYDDAIAPIMRPFATTLLALLGLTGDADRPRLLDVAAGTGVVAIEAARRGADVLATDFAPGMVEVMRRRFAADDLPARAEVMDGQDLDLDDAIFDLATSTFGLMFFADPAEGLRELHRVLRPGGQVGIATWAMTQPGLPQLIAAALARVAPGLPAPPPPPWARLCEPPGLKEALREAGFARIAVHEVTHARDLGDAADFFRRLPECTPPLRPLFASLPSKVVNGAADAFADLVRAHSTDEGLPQTALIGIGSRLR